MLIRLYKVINGKYYQISEIDKDRLYPVACYYAKYKFCGNIIIRYYHKDGSFWDESFAHYANLQGIPLKIREEDYII